MAGHAQLKFVMTECSKTQIRLAGLLISWAGSNMLLTSSCSMSRALVVLVLGRMFVSGRKGLTTGISLRYVKSWISSSAMLRVKPNKPATEILLLYMYESGYSKTCKMARASREDDKGDSQHKPHAQMNRITTKPTNWSIWPAKTQISLGIRPDWSESSLSAWRNIWSIASQAVLVLAHFVSFVTAAKTIILPIVLRGRENR